MMFHVKHSSIVSGLLRRITLRADLAVARSPAGRSGVWAHRLHGPLATFRNYSHGLGAAPRRSPLYCGRREVRAALAARIHVSRETWRARHRFASTLASPGQKPRTLRLIGSPRVNRAFGGGLWHLGLTFGAVSNHNLPPVHRLRVQPLSHVCSTTAMAAPRE